MDGTGPAGTEQDKMVEGPTGLNEEFPITPPKKKTTIIYRYGIDPEFRALTLARAKERVMCDACGYEVTRGNLAAHRKSRRHQLALQAKQKPDVKYIILTNDQLQELIAKKN